MFDFNETLNAIKKSVELLSHPTPEKIQAAKQQLEALAADIEGSKRKFNNEVAKAMHLELTGSFEMSEGSFFSATTLAYGTGIQLLGVGDDEINSCEIESIYELDDADQETLDKAIESGYIEAYQIRFVFQDLFNKGMIPPGKFYVKSS